MMVAEPESLNNAHGMLCMIQRTSIPFQADALSEGT